MLLPRLFACAAAISLMAASNPEPLPSTGARTVLRVQEMDGRLTLIGRLGRELGTILTVDGDIVDGSVLRSKDLDGVKLLKVTSLGSTTILRDPIYLRFEWYDGSDTSSLSDHVTLVGFETGAFTGFPAEAFAHIPPSGSNDFHFETSFVVLKQKGG